VAVPYAGFVIKLGKIYVKEVLLDLEEDFSVGVIALSPVLNVLDVPVPLAPLHNVTD